MPGIESVTSAANPLLKDVRRAVMRGSLTSAGFCVAEGFHLLEEAVRSGRELGAVIVSESARDRLGARLEGSGGARVAVVPEALFDGIASTETSQGVIALVRPVEWRFEQLFAGCALIVVLDRLQDPGNAGALARVAEAFGATGVVFVKGSVSPHHPKTLRASAGSLFRIPFLAGVEASALADELRSRHLSIHAAMPWTGAETPASAADFRNPCAIVIGGEGGGIGAELRSVARPVSIRTAGVESLNAASAASVLLYEASRQRG